MHPHFSHRAAEREQGQTRSYWRQAGSTLQQKMARVIYSEEDPASEGGSF